MINKSRRCKTSQRSICVSRSTGRISSRSGKKCVRGSSRRCSNGSGRKTSPPRKTSRRKTSRRKTASCKVSKRKTSRRKVSRRKTSRCKTVMRDTSGHKHSGRRTTSRRTLVCTSTQKSHCHDRNSRSLSPHNGTCSRSSSGTTRQSILERISNSAPGSFRVSRVSSSGGLRVASASTGRPSTAVVTVSRISKNM